MSLSLCFSHFNSKFHRSEGAVCMCQVQAHVISESAPLSLIRPHASLLSPLMFVPQSLLLSPNNIKKCLPIPYSIGTRVHQRFVSRKVQGDEMGLNLIGTWKSCRGPNMSHTSALNLGWSTDVKMRLNFKIKSVRGQNVSQTSALSLGGSKEVKIGLNLNGIGILELCQRSKCVADQCLGLGGSNQFKIGLNSIFTRILELCEGSECIAHQFFG